MILGVTSFKTMVSHSSRKCCRWALASSLGRLQNGLAYTIMIRPVFSWKFALPMLIAGPTGMLATMGTEYSRSVLSAIAFSTDGAWMTGSVAGGVMEGGLTWGQAFFRNDSGFSVKVVGKSKPSYTILFSPIIGENKQSYPVMINGYYTCILSWTCPNRFF
jgi:hypothetical protein